MAPPRGDLDDEPTPAPPPRRAQQPPASSSAPNAAPFEDGERYILARRRSPREAGFLPSVPPVASGN
jgi:hypothetical protein